MAIALAEALSKDRSLSDPAFAMNRWVSWYRHGEDSHTGACFDIGRQTSLALDMWADFKRLPEHDTERAGNGGIMRLSPAVLANLFDQVAALKVAQRQSDLTHRNHLCRQVAGKLAGISFRLIHEGSQDVVPTVIASRSDVEVEATGYVLDTFEAALLAFAPRDGFAQIVLRAVNLGDDADTVGAVAGQLAGAAYGLTAIPTAWLEILAWRDKLIALAQALCALAPN